MSAFIDAHRERFGVEPICRTLGVSASAYYQRATGERSERSVEDERLTRRIREVHGQNFECYGYPRVWHRSHGAQEIDLARRCCPGPKTFRGRRNG